MRIKSFRGDVAYFGGKTFETLNIFGVPLKFHLYFIIVFTLCSELSLEQYLVIAKHEATRFLSKSFVSFPFLLLKHSVQLILGYLQGRDYCALSANKAT